MPAVGPFLEFLKEYIQPGLVILGLIVFSYIFTGLIFSVTFARRVVSILYRGGKKYSSDGAQSGITRNFVLFFYPRLRRAEDFLFVRKEPNGPLRTRNLDIRKTGGRFLVLSLMYPVVWYLIAWAFGASVQFGNRDLIPGDMPLLERRALFGAIVLIVILTVKAYASGGGRGEGR